MKEYKVGIDIGGTNTKVGAVNKKGEIISKSNFKTQIFNSEIDFINVLSNHIINLSKNINEESKIKGIGIGAPNGNYYTGTIENAPNLRWGGNVPIVKILKTKFNVPIKLTNDANAAAMGEMLYGKAKGMNNFIMITLGTGLGSGFVVNGKLMLGHDGFAGELGHIIAVPDGRLCGCGRNGCLETYASATGIKTTVFEMLNVLNTESVLRNHKSEEIDSKIIYKAAIQGDKIALNSFDFTAKILGEKLADIVAVFSPEAIFFFGGLAEAGDLLINATKKYMEKNIMPIFKNKVKLEQSGLIHRNAAVIGASALI